MNLKSPHRDWKLPVVSVMDVRAVGGLDQVLTHLWLRVHFGNHEPARRAQGHRTIGGLAAIIEAGSTGAFQGFANSPGAAEAWLRSDLVRTLRKSPETFTVAAPAHLKAARVRNVAGKHADDSAASLAVYSWLHHEAPDLIPRLRAFIEAEIDPDVADLPTLALAGLGDAMAPDVPKPGEAAEPPRPACPGHARVYGDDLRKLLVCEGTMPRTRLVEHLRTLTGFHLGLYLLKLFRRVIAIDRGPDSTAGACAGEAGLVVDFGSDARSNIAKLAERSWTEHEDALARYVRAHLELKKLDQYAATAAKELGHPVPPRDTVEDIAAIEFDVPRDRLDPWFLLQRTDLVRTAGADDDEREHVRGLAEQYQRLGLTPFRVYSSLVAHFSEKRWAAYHVQLPDSLFVKNSGDGLLQQPLGGRRRRRAAMGPGLLETLTLIAMVERSADGAAYTRALRVDELIERLERRYGLLITTPPSDQADDLHVAQMLAGNVDRFRARLRETGLFTDLSDAFLNQLVRPRYHVNVR